MTPPISITDPGRTLLHALVYLTKHASLYPTEAWIEAQNILHRAHQQFEDDDRIQFVRELERHEAAQSTRVQAISVRLRWKVVSLDIWQRVARHAFAAFASSYR